jgi:hypothetical protein
LPELESIWSWSLKDKTPTPESMFWPELEFIPEFKNLSRVGVLLGAGVSWKDETPKPCPAPSIWGYQVQSLIKRALDWF